MRGCLVEPGVCSFDCVRVRTMPGTTSGRSWGSARVAGRNAGVVSIAVECARPSPTGVTVVDGVVDTGWLTIPGMFTDTRTAGRGRVVIVDNPLVPMPLPTHGGGACVIVDIVGVTVYALARCGGVPEFSNGVTVLTS